MCLGTLTRPIAGTTMSFVAPLPRGPDRQTTGKRIVRYPRFSFPLRSATMNDRKNPSRRDFLKAGTASATGLVLAGGVNIRGWPTLPAAMS